MCLLPRARSHPEKRLQFRAPEALSVGGEGGGSPPGREREKLLQARLQRSKRLHRAASSFIP
eukprot:14634979-Alexandrium_andersonii.AAC.1